MSDNIMQIPLTGVLVPGIMEGYIVKSQYIQGGYIVVKTIADRDALLSKTIYEDNAVIVDGSLVYVSEEKLSYRYNATTQGWDIDTVDVAAIEQEISDLQAAVATKADSTYVNQALALKAGRGEENTFTRTNTFNSAVNVGLTGSLNVQGPTTAANINADALTTKNLTVSNSTITLNGQTLTAPDKSGVFALLSDVELPSRYDKIEVGPEGLTYAQYNSADIEYHGITAGESPSPFTLTYKFPHTTGVITDTAYTLATLEDIAAAGGGDVVAAGDNIFTGNNTFTGTNNFTAADKSFSVLPVTESSKTGQASTIPLNMPKGLALGLFVANRIDSVLSINNEGIEIGQLTKSGEDLSWSSKRQFLFPDSNSYGSYFVLGDEYGAAGYANSAYNASYADNATTADTAHEAERAIADEEGNNIVSTYLSAEGNHTLTGQNNFFGGDSINSAIHPVVNVSLASSTSDDHNPENTCHSVLTVASSQSDTPAGKFDIQFCPAAYNPVANEATLVATMSGSAFNSTCRMWPDGVGVYSANDGSVPWYAYISTDGLHAVGGYSDAHMLYGPSTISYTNRDSTSNKPWTLEFPSHSGTIATKEDIPFVGSFAKVDAANTFTGSNTFNQPVTVAGTAYQSTGIKTATNTLTFPAKTGTVALTSDIPAGVAELNQENNFTQTNSFSVSNKPEEHVVIYGPRAPLEVYHGDTYDLATLIDNGFIYLYKGDGSVTEFYPDKIMTGRSSADIEITYPDESGKLTTQEWVYAQGFVQLSSDNDFTGSNSFERLTMRGDLDTGGYPFRVYAEGDMVIFGSYVVVDSNQIDFPKKAGTLATTDDITTAINAAITTTLNTAV